MHARVRDAYFASHWSHPFTSTSLPHLALFLIPSIHLLFHRRSSCSPSSAGRENQKHKKRQKDSSKSFPKRSYRSKSRHQQQINTHRDLHPCSHLHPINPYASPYTGRNHGAVARRVYSSQRRFFRSLVAPLEQQQGLGLRFRLCVSR